MIATCPGFSEACFLASRNKGNEGRDWLSNMAASGSQTSVGRDLSNRSAKGTVTTPAAMQAKESHGGSRREAEDVTAVDMLFFSLSLSASVSRPCRARLRGSPESYVRAAGPRQPSSDARLYGASAVSRSPHFPASNPGYSAKPRQAPAIPCFWGGLCWAAFSSFRVQLHPGRAGHLVGDPQCC